MIVLDVNVLVAAYREDHPGHAAALSLLTSALSDDEIAVPDLVWVGFFRIVTNQRIFPVPASFDEAASFARAVTNAPGYRHIAGLDDGFDPFYALASESRATGNLIPDAYIAAVAASHGSPVATFDRDFRRFDGVTIVEPGRG